MNAKNEKLFLNRILSCEAYNLSAAYSVSSEVILGIPQANKMRKDKTQVLYCGSSIFDVWIFRLNPEQVFCLSLFNGKRSIRDIIAIIASITGEDEYMSEVKI